VIQVLDDNTLGIGKGVLGFIERNSVLFRVLCILEVIPFKVRWFNGANVIQTDAIFNLKKGIVLFLQPALNLLYALGTAYIEVKMISKENNFDFNIRWRLPEAENTRQETCKDE